MEPFESMLSGGHPNSLARTVEVVDQVLANPDRMDALFACYGSEDEVVRLRVSSAMKRIGAVRRHMLVPLIDRFLSEISQLDQPSAQWTLADLFKLLEGDMTPSQKARAQDILQRNLAEHGDWIVLNRTMDTLMCWGQSDPDLRAWLMPHLERLGNDPRNSVGGRARKHLAALG